jgi:hypothetical protein
MTRRIVALLGAISTATVVWHPNPVHAQPSAAQVLSDMGWTADDQQRVLNGEFVTNDATGVSDKDLALSIAFLVKTSPADLSEQIIAGNIIGTDPQVRESGEFSGGGSLADLARLQVDQNTLQAFLNARPGEKLNLSTGEIGAFDALQSTGPEAAQPQLRQMLLNRFQAYQASGLAGIAPYDRGGSTTDVAQELRKASDALTVLHKYMPAFQQVLTDYPRATVPGLRQTFRWVHYDIDGTTTLVLMHELTAADGTARAVVQRQYYVSNGYNAEQAAAGFLPVQGGTIVAYTNHTFTDQVAGFGGGVKRSIGRRMMASKLTQMFETARKGVGMQ